MGKWEKLGQIFTVQPVDEYLVSHASNPTPVHLDGDVYRIFYSGRDRHNRSSVGYADIDIVTHKTIRICDRAIFTYGPENSFYSHGVSIGNFYSTASCVYVLFMGWKIKSGEHWRGDIGRLRLEGKDSLFLDPTGIYIGSDEEDKISLSYPWVSREGDFYEMWYGSTLTWSSENGEMVHIIKYATSRDGEVWSKHGGVIPYKLGVAQAFSRPTVLIHEGKRHMWFSYRSGSGEKYRIGYAVASSSDDGWRVRLNQDIGVSSFGWDSEMICYPFVFKHKGEIYMLYNGNGFGATGFGIARFEREA